MGKRMRWNNVALFGSFILLTFCVQSLKAKEISKNELANVKGSAWSGWICGYCWDACQNLGTTEHCESVTECEGSGSLDTGDACGQLYMSTSTPTETVLWCYGGETDDQIYCYGNGDYSTCSSWEGCRCYDPGLDIAFCEVVFFSEAGDNDNCEVNHTVY